MYWIVLLKLLLVISFSGFTATYEIPEGATAMNGTWHEENCEVENIKLVDASKTLEVNPETQKFIVYSADQSEIFGDLEFELNAEETFRLQVDMDITNAYAERIQDNDFEVKQWRYGGIKKRRIEQ